MPFDNPFPTGWTVVDPAPWHRGRTELLTEALAEAFEAAPGLRGQAAELLPRLPRRPLASQTIRSTARDRYSSALPLNQAVTCPWMALDGQDSRNVLAFDVDHGEAIELCAELQRRGAPVPWLVLDPWSGRAHAFLPLRTPVLCSPEARIGPQLLANLAARLMGEALKANPMPRGALLKSPWGQLRYLTGARLLRGPRPADPTVWAAYMAADSGLMWHTIPGSAPTELRAIIAALAEDEDGEPSPVLSSPKRQPWVGKALPWKKHRPEPSALGRNCALFDIVRFWAYDQVERDGGAILAKAMAENARLPIPLPLSEVSATARSIARFMASRFNPKTGLGKVQRGRDADTRALALTERRVIAGKRSASARSTATDSRIRGALIDLQAAGTALSQQALANAAKVSLRTVKGRWSRFGLVQDGALSGGAEGNEAGVGLQKGRKEAKKDLTHTPSQTRPTPFLMTATSMESPSTRLDAISTPELAQTMPVAAHSDRSMESPALREAEIPHPPGPDAAPLASHMAQATPGGCRIPRPSMESPLSIQPPPSMESPVQPAPSMESPVVRPLTRRSSLLPFPSAEPILAPVGLQHGHVDRARCIQETVAELMAVTQQALRRGVEPPEMPLVAEGLAEEPAVFLALQDAMRAVSDAMRRAAGRAKLVAAAEYRADLRAAVVDPNRGWFWWRAKMAALEEIWDAREQEAMLDGDRYALASVRTQRGWAFGRCWKQWRAACLAMAPEQPRARQMA